MKKIYKSKGKKLIYQNLSKECKIKTWLFCFNFDWSWKLLGNSRKITKI